MKNTIITLASVVALAGSVNAQVALGGTTYAPGTYLQFANQADLLSGVNPTIVAVTGEGTTWTDTAFVRALHRTSGSLDQGSTNIGTATWSAGNLADFYIDQSTGTYNAQVLNPILGFAIGDYITFANQSDFLAGTSASLIANTGVGSTWSDGVFQRALNKTSGSLDQGSTNLGTVAWGAGKLADFNYNQATGAYQVQVATVPEPSSTALLGLGGLALILRRRK